jgi:transposase
MIPTRTTADLLLGMWTLIQLLGRVPRRLIWDNETGIGRGKRHAAGIGAFTGTLATTLIRLKPRDPESKGVVERRNGYFETSFMPGRDFSSPADFNTQFTEWLTKANARTVRTIKARPVDLIDADRAAMLPLPPVAPAVGWVNRVRLGRDYYVRLDSNDYSVDPTVIGRFVEVAADLARVEVRHESRLVAAHDRIWARGMTITDPAHLAAAKVLREQFQMPRPAVDVHDGLGRDLADYDRAFGLIDGGLNTPAANGEVA